MITYEFSIDGAEGKYTFAYSDGLHEVSLYCSPSWYSVPFVARSDGAVFGAARTYNLRGVSPRDWVVLHNVMDMTWEDIITAHSGSLTPRTLRTLRTYPPRDLVQIIVGREVLARPFLYQDARTLLPRWDGYRYANANDKDELERVFSYGRTWRYARVGRLIRFIHVEVYRDDMCSGIRRALGALYGVPEDAITVITCPQWEGIDG